MSDLDLVRVGEVGRQVGGGEGGVVGVELDVG